MRDFMKVGAIWLLVIIITTLHSSVIAAEDNYLRVIVKSAFIELHSGPNEKFPVTRIVERDEFMDIIERRTNWYRVTDRKGYGGWVKHDDMLATNTISGEPPALETIFTNGDRTGYAGFGLATGQLNDDPLIAVRGGYHFSKNMMAEIEFLHSPGKFTNNYILGGNLVLSPLPDAFISPYLSLGAGYLKNEPRDSLIGAIEFDATVWNYALGIQKKWGDRLDLRLEYREYTALVNEELNRDYDAITFGLSVLY